MGYQVGGNELLSTTPLLSGVWYNIVLSHPAGGTGTYYINGIAAGPDKGPLVDARGGSTPIYIGGMAGYFFSGSIDEVRIYNRALSSGDIQNLYNSNLAKYATNRRTFTTIFSGLAEGTYLYSGTAIDLANNSSGIVSRPLIIDKTALSLNWTGATPINGYFSSGNNFTGQIDIS